MALETNKTDYPLTGLLARFHTWLVPQRDPALGNDLVRQAPSTTFIGLFKNILKDKGAVWFLTTGYLLEALFVMVFISMPLVVGRYMAYFLEEGGISHARLTELSLIIMAMLFCNMLIGTMSVRQADRSRGSGEALTRRQLTWWVLGHSAGWFSTREAGQIAHRIAEVSRQVSVILGYIVWEIFPIIVSLTYVAILMFVTDLYAGLFFIVWAFIFIVSSIRMGLVSQKFMMRTVKRRTEAAGLVTDIVINNALVRLFKSRNREDLNVNDHSRQCYEAYIESSSWARVKNFLRDFLIMILMGGIIYILGHGVINDRITLPLFIGSMGTVFMMVTSIRALHHIIRDTMEAIGSVREGLISIGTPHDIIDPAIEGKKVKLNNASIDLKNVNFQYQNSKNILNDVNINIPNGQKLGLIGPSGAGKTTLMSLLLRLWDLEQGEILIDGKNIKDIPFDVLRENIALIPQDTSLLHRSLKENIRYSRPSATDEEVIQAAKQAFAHDFIMDLPQGYDTMVGERGVKLSGGQRQRVAIARVILSDAPILILDEATSALDSESEHLIQQSLKTVMEGKTVIAIAHRLSTISHLDRLIVMNEGAIVEEGNHKELLEQGGLYAKLWSMQSGGFLTED